MYKRLLELITNPENIKTDEDGNKVYLVSPIELLEFVISELPANA